MTSDKKPIRIIYFIIRISIMTDMSWIFLEHFELHKSFFLETCFESIVGLLIFGFTRILPSIAGNVSHNIFNS